MGLFKRKEPTVVVGHDSDSREALRSLAQRLALTGGQTPRVVTFIAARSGEGTTSLALKYASLLAFESGKHVLLIDASSNIAACYADIGINSDTGIIDAALGDLPMEAAIRGVSQNLSVVRWLARVENRAVADRISQNTEFWKKLHSAFGSIVIDAPSLQSSFDGVMLAAKADTTVIVVEAEATPAPVTQKLHDVLKDAGAKVAGLVLTKRRFYIPQKAYKKL